MKKRGYVLPIIFLLLCLTGGCKKAENSVQILEEKSGSARGLGTEQAEADKEATGETDEEDEVYVPAKETVLALRERAEEGMTQEDIADLTEMVKVANLKLENLLLNYNLEKKLSDPDNLYWNYFEQTGEIQIEESDAGEAVTAGNPYNGENFINVMEKWEKKVTNEELKEDFGRMADYMDSAVEAHSVEDIMSLYQMLHDMDYFLFRYGPEDVGKYTKDLSTVCKFYGVLSIYENIDVNQ